LNIEQELTIFDLRSIPNFNVYVDFVNRKSLFLVLKSIIQLNFDNYPIYLLKYGFIVDHRCQTPDVGIFILHTGNYIAHIQDDISEI